MLDTANRVAGVISRQDIFHGSLAWSLGLGTVHHTTLLSETPAKDVMQTDVVTVTPDTPLKEAASSMIRHKIGCLPVTEGAQLVGIVTDGDLLALLARPAR